MQEFNFTPGPWEWWTSNSFLRLSSLATGKDGGVIDSFSMSDGATSLSVKVADMHLIAAAPELLEALQECLPWVNNGLARGAQLKAVSAINKALGK